MDQSKYTYFMLIRSGHKLRDKSDIKAEQCKTEGNAKYSQCEYIEALKLYNKALCYAQSKEKLALLYGNRSAVYFELKKYKESLKNIQWARENGYPADKIQRLIEREQKCKKLVNTQLKIEHDTRQKFNFAYETNPKVPFIVDCVEVQKTNEYGRGLYATRNMKAGDVILVEEPLFGSVNEKGFASMCNFCFSINQLNLIPCLKSASLMFCSVQCRDKAYEKFPDLQMLLPKNFLDDVWNKQDENSLNRIVHELDYAFGGREKLMNFIMKENYQKRKKTPLDYDLTNLKDTKYQKYRILGSLSLINNALSEEATWIRDWASQLSEGNKLFEEFLKHIFSIITRNKLMFKTRQDNLELMGLFPVFELINHSCWPNAIHQIIEGKVIVTLIKPIRAGDQIFINYLLPDQLDEPAEDRDHYFGGYFKCKCYLCRSDFTPEKLPSLPDATINFCNYRVQWYPAFYAAVFKELQGMMMAKMLHQLEEFLEVMNKAICFSIRSKEVYKFERQFHIFYDRICFLMMYPYIDPVPFPYELSISKENRAVKGQKVESPLASYILMND